MAAPPPPIGAPLYAILRHDAAPQDQSRPALVDIVFPDATGKIVAHINLMLRFHHLFNQAESADEVHIDENLDIGFHPDSKEKRKSV
jgi:hypothetical protein